MEAAMESEMDSIYRNEAWELVELPVGKQPIKGKWIYRLKMDSRGNSQKHQGCLQEALNNVHILILKRLLHLWWNGDQFATYCTCNTSWVGDQSNGRENCFLESSPEQRSLPHWDLKKKEKKSWWVDLRNLYMDWSSIQEPSIRKWMDFWN